MTTMLQAVSPRTGIIREISEYPRPLLEPQPPFIYKSTLSNFDFRSADGSERMTAGKGESREQALIGAIGEAFERYCAGLVDRKALVRASFAEMRQAAIAPSEFVLYSDAQYERPAFAYRRWDENSAIQWIRGFTWPDRKPVFVPASMVYLSASLMEEPPFWPVTSTGLAAGPDLDTAIRQGICEVVERDAFLLTWMNRSPVPRLDYSNCGVAQQIASHYRRFDRELHAFHITVDIAIAVMMAIVVNRTGNGLAAAVGLGCDLDPAAALERAVFEACQVHASESARLARGPLTDPSRGYEQVKTLWDHSGYFSIPERLHEFDFLLNTARTVQLESIPRAPTIDIPQRIIAIDLTTRDVAELGMRVVRVLATGLQPMHFGYGEERLGGTRISSLELNPCPHPFG